MARFRPYTFEVSRFGLDGGAMFGVVPKTLWERVFPPDASNRISMVTRCLVLRSLDSDRVVVVDAGFGLDWTDQEVERYAVDTSVPSIEAALETVGITADQVTDAVVTHLHFDHAGGFTRVGPDGSTVPVFGKARHHVQKRHWQSAASPTLRDRGSFIAKHFEPLSVAGLVNLVDGEGELFDGVDVMVLSGHTTDLQIPIIRGTDETLVFPSDLIPTAAHVKLPWIMAYDQNPALTLTEKTRFLDTAAALDWTVVFEHDPTVVAAKIERTKGGFVPRSCSLPGEI